MQKVGYRQVAKLADLSPRLVIDISTGKQARISEATETAILEIRASLAKGVRINGWREQRLINSMLTEGFPAAEIARRLGYLTPKLQLGRYIRVETALKIRALYAAVNAEGAELPARTPAPVSSKPAGDPQPPMARRRSDRPTALALVRTKKKAKPGAWYWFDPIYRVSHILVSSEADQILPTLQLLVAQDGFDPGFRALTHALWLDGLQGRVDGCAGRFSGVKRDGHQCSLVWFPPKVEIPTIAHELLHATAFALTRSGVAFSDESEEAFAYYIGWLMDETLDRLYGKA